MKLRTLSASLMLAGFGLVAQPAFANISDDVIRIGFVTDMASVYSDIDGPGGIEAARMAIADAVCSIDQSTHVEVLGLPTKFIPHDPKSEAILARFGLDADSLVAIRRQRLQSMGVREATNYGQMDYILEYLRNVPLSCPHR